MVDRLHGVRAGISVPGVRVSDGNGSELPPHGHGPAGSEWLGESSTRRYVPATSPYRRALLNAFWPFARIGHCLLALVIGAAAGISWPGGSSPLRERLRSRRAAAATPEPTAHARDAGPWAVGVWPGDPIYAVIAALGDAGRPLSLRAGMTVLLTCAVPWPGGLAAVFSQGRRRADGGWERLLSVPATWSWCRRHTATRDLGRDSLGDRLSWRRPPMTCLVAPTERRAASEGIAGANARILKALEQPFRSTSPGKSPWRRPCTYVSTSGTNRRRTPASRSTPTPIALQQAGQDLAAHRVPGAGGRPLEDRPALPASAARPVATRIKGGLIEVVSEVDRISIRGYRSEPAYEDPLLLTGHRHRALIQARSSLTTFPCTSVRRKSRPWNW